MKVPGCWWWESQVVRCFTSKHLQTRFHSALISVYLSKSCVTESKVHSQRCIFCSSSSTLASVRWHVISSLLTFALFSFVWKSFVVASSKQFTIAKSSKSWTSVKKNDLGGSSFSGTLPRCCQKAQSKQNFIVFFSFEFCEYNLEGRWACPWWWGEWR